MEPRTARETARSAAGVLVSVSLAVACNLPSTFRGRSAADSGPRGDGAPGADASDSEPPTTDTATDAVPGVDSAPPGCPLGAWACAGYDLQQCNPATGAYDTVATCSFGCDAVGGRCLSLAPANDVDPAWLLETTAPFDTTALGYDEFEWYTNTGEIRGRPAGGSWVPIRMGVPGIDAGIGFHTVVQGPGLPNVGVWTFGSVTLAAGQTHRFFGGLSGATPGLGIPEPAAAIASGGPVVVAATLNLDAWNDAGSHDWRPGPGGWEGGHRAFDFGAGIGYGAGPGGGPSPTGTCDSGGGGAGHRIGGGAGGTTSDACAVVVPGGVAYGAANLVPLRGGSGGGAGGDSSTPTQPGDGGGGGGALQISSLDALTVSGTIHAGGGGGEAATNGEAGGGGGPGGAVLLEGASVTVTGTIACNGGGGASGSSSGGTDGANGTTGLPMAAPAPGGASSGSGSGAGGAGASGTAAAGLGTGSVVNAGGGGGATGRIRINTPDGTALLPGVLSPTASVAITGTF